MEWVGIEAGPKGSTAEPGIILACPTLAPQTGPSHPGQPALTGNIQVPGPCRHPLLITTDQPAHPPVPTVCPGVIPHLSLHQAAQPASAWGRKGLPTPKGVTDLCGPRETLGALILVLAEAVTLGVILCHWTAKGNSYHETEYLWAERDLGVPSAKLLFVRWGN